MMIQLALVAVLFACAQYYVWAIGREAAARGLSLRESRDMDVHHPF